MLSLSSSRLHRRWPQRFIVHDCASLVTSAANACPIVDGSVLSFAVALYVSGPVFASWTPTCAFDAVAVVHVNCSYVDTLSQCVCFFGILFCSFNYFSCGCGSTRCCHHALSLLFALIQIPFLCTLLPTLLYRVARRGQWWRSLFIHDFLLRFVRRSDAAANVNPRHSESSDRQCSVRTYVLPFCFMLGFFRALRRGLFLHFSFSVSTSFSPFSILITPLHCWFTV